MIPWHRLLGLALTDYFHGTGWRVEVEKDLALKRQLLDVLIIEQGPYQPAALADPCDGFETLRPHNLLTYKSLHEPLDAWAVEELIGHYVNYRKTLEPMPLPESFGLYAVCARYPAGLARQTTLTPVKPGLYRLLVLSQPIMIVVLSNVAISQRNALWELFSHDNSRIAHGAQHYRWRQPDYNTLFRLILRDHLAEGLTMPYTMEDLRRDAARELLDELPPEERLRGLPPEERVKGLTLDDILKTLSADEKSRLLRLLIGGEGKPQ